MKHLKLYTEFSLNEQQLIINDILNEGIMKDKVLSYIKKGALTATILLSLLGSVKGSEKEEILEVVKKEAPELYQNVEQGEQTPFMYEEVINLDSTFKQSNLFYNANEWIAENFRSAKDVIQMSDKDAGIIIIKGSIPLRVTAFLTDGSISFTLKIQVKNGKYKYTFSNYYHTSYKGDEYSGGSLDNEQQNCIGLYMMKKGWTQIKEQADEYTKLMINSLKQNMSKKTTDDSF